MHACLDTNKPWVSRYDGSEYTLRWDEDRDNWWHAYTIDKHLNMYLRDHYKANQRGLIYRTGWHGARLNRNDGLVKWSVTGMWRSETLEPHLVCTLADKTPLRDDYISVAEMRTILTLSGARAIDEGHRHRKVIPVTVISTAGKQLRVVVGVVDSGKKSIEVRRGPIIDLSGGVEKNWAAWVTVLCWMVGEPIGVTV